MKFRNMARRLRLAAFFSPLLFAGVHPSALAGGTSNPNQSAAGVATVGAGQAAAADDASVIFFNPAALTRFKRAELLNTFAVGFFENEYTSRQDNDGAPNSQGTQGSNGQTFSRNEGFDGALVAPSLFIAVPYNEKLVLGFSASGSHGLLARYQAGYPGRGQGRDVDFKITRLNLGFGYKLSNTLSLGMNGSYERYYQKIVLRINFRDAVNKLSPGSATALDTLAAVGAAPPIPDETDGKLRMFGWAFNAQAGVLWEPSENTRVGLSYRPTTKFDGNSGKLTINENEDTAAFRDFLRGPAIQAGGPLLGVDGAAAAGDLEPSQRVRQNIDFPDELRLSVFHHATPKLDLMATYTREDYTVSQLRFERESNGRLVESVPQNYQVAHSYRIGAAYKLYNRLTLLAGYASENGVVKDDLRIPLLPDNDRKFYGIGARYDLNRDTSLTFAYQLLDIAEGQVGNNDQVTPVEVSGAEYKGTTNLDLHFFSVSLREQF